MVVDSDETIEVRNGVSSGYGKASGDGNGGVESPRPRKRRKRSGPPLRDDDATPPEPPDVAPVESAVALQEALAPITVLQNTPIPVTDPRLRAETSLCNAGQSVFITGNRFAAESDDHGATWRSLDLDYALPYIDGGVCCDQTTIYIPKIGHTVWIAQYSKYALPTNVLRIAVRPAGGAWRYWDFRPTDVDKTWTNDMFDYNAAALSDNFLYVTSDVLTPSRSGDIWARSVALRFRIDDLLNDAPLLFQHFVAKASNLRPTQGARNVMYFGGHESASRLRLYTWRESDATSTFQSISVKKWIEGTSYSAPCPDGRDWLGRRLDGRITAAWTGAGEIGFAWTANAMTGIPYPFVRAVRINETTRAVIGYADISSQSRAYAYPEVCTNANGVPGISLFAGGGAIFPSHVVGVFAGGQWKLQTVTQGTHSPIDEEWGDYISIRRHSPDETSWIASGFTLQGGPFRFDIEPRLVHFRI